MRILRGELPDDRPGAVAAAVIYEQDPAVAGDESCGVQVFYFCKEERRCQWQDLLFVVAGNDDTECGCTAVHLRYLRVVREPSPRNRP